MSERDEQRIDEAIDVVEAHPYIATGFLISQAKNSDTGIYLSGVYLGEGKHGMALAMALEDERASKLVNFLHDLTEGAVSNWEDFAYVQEVMRQPAGKLAEEGEA